MRTRAKLQTTVLESEIIIVGAGLLDNANAIATSSASAAGWAVLIMRGG